MRNVGIGEFLGELSGGIGRKDVDWREGCVCARSAEMGVGFRSSCGVHVLLLRPKL
jgi:hypothetical protein